MALSLAQEFESVGEKYKKILKIGCGTFGEAWLVSSLCSGRSYVLKEVKVTDLSEDDLEKTQREAAVLARCKHINIIRYKESFLIHNPLTMCLVMEYADGGDLYEKVKQSKTLKKLIPEVSIMSWFIQIIFAVQYLHRNNILHRDLKTQNIFLTHKNIVKVGDFGIARFLRTKQELATTAIGTPYYLSPEICLRNPYNHRSDMWSVGCILYELCALRHPFEANDFENLVLKILQEAYTSVSCAYSKLVHDLITVLLRKNPEQRPSAEQILIIPGLKLIVQGYLKKHEEIMSGFSNNRISQSAIGSPVVQMQFFQPKHSPSGYRLSTGARPKLNHLNQERNKDLLAYQFDIFHNDIKDSFDTPFSPIELVQPEKRDSQTQTPPDWMVRSRKGSCENNSSICFNGHHSPDVQDRDPKVAIISPVKETRSRKNFTSMPKEDIESSPTLGKTFTIFSSEKMIQTA